MDEFERFRREARTATPQGRDRLVVWGGGVGLILGFVIAHYTRWGFLVWVMVGTAFVAHGARARASGDVVDTFRDNPYLDRGPPGPDDDFDLLAFLGIDGEDPLRLMMVGAAILLLGLLALIRS